jgi:hypothetical protein
MIWFFLLAAATWQPDAQFWKVWGDGHAELAGYELTFPRYGQPRKGTAVTIFVSETFSNQLRVKADPGVHPVADQYPVMKLNLMEDYQTGIYDYNDMTSAFVALAPINSHPIGSLTKVSSSSQEWCGQTYQQVLFDSSKVRYTLHSYFDNEADQNKDLPYPANGVSEDQLLLWARGMAWPFLQPGESISVPFLFGLRTTRQAHKPLAWGRAKLSVGKALTTINWGGATVSVQAFTVEIDNGPTRTYLVETAGAKRVLQWKSSTGEQATLLKSKRFKYWEMNREGFEKNLAELGLRLRPARTM